MMMTMLRRRMLLLLLLPLLLLSLLFCVLITHPSLVLLTNVAEYPFHTTQEALVPRETVTAGSNSLCLSMQVLVPPHRRVSTRPHVGLPGDQMHHGMVLRLQRYPALHHDTTVGDVLVELLLYYHGAGIARARAQQLDKPCQMPPCFQSFRTQSHAATKSSQQTHTKHITHTPVLEMQ